VGTEGRVTMKTLLAALVALMLAVPALAHITPPVVLLSDREALTSLLAGARRFFVREVRLSAAQRDAIEKTSGWRPDEDFYRFYLGRDTDGRLVSAAIFVTEFTIHGPVRVVVGLAPDGTVRGARVVEVTEETYPWVKPLLDRDFTAAHVGHDARTRFRPTTTMAHPMAEFYAQVISGLIQRAAILFEAGGVG